MHPGLPALPSGIDEHSVYRSIFAAYPDALLMVDQAGVIVLANPAAALLLGYSQQELAGMGVDVLVPDAARSRHAAYRDTYGQMPQARPMGTQTNLTARCKDGSEVMVEIALSPLQEHGLPFVLAAIRGIGSYPRVKQALKLAQYSEHLAQLGRMAVDARDIQTVLDLVPRIAAEALQVEVATVYLLEDRGQVLRIASGAGLLPGQEVGTSIPYDESTSPGLVLEQGVPLVVEDYRTERRFVVPEAYLSAGLSSALVVPLHDHGSMIGAVAARSRLPMRFGSDEIYFLESLSNLLATSLQRERSEEALNHAQRLETVGQLTGGIAHDFNNLLTVIQGNLEVLKELPVLAQDGHGHGRQLIAAAARATRRAAELTGKLLAFSRRQRLQPVPIETAAMLHSLADMLRRTLDQRIRIEIDTNPNCPAVLADPGQLEAALLNIAINARDAMPEGGLLRVKAQACTALPEAVRRSLEHPHADGQFVAIAVSDTGSGMSDEIKERAFEPFFTTKASGRGTGLGLSTVYGFAKQSHGAVTLGSAPGSGTTVTLYSPQPCTSPLRSAEAHSGNWALPLDLKVLLVEDDSEVRKVAQSFLVALGCRTTTAATAEQALMTLGSATSFDLLLTDIALGAGMRGTALASEVQRRFPSVAILLTSGFSAELLEADRSSPSGWELLRKPYSRDALAEAIAKLLANRG